MYHKRQMCIPEKDILLFDSKDEEYCFQQICNIDFFKYILVLPPVTDNSLNFLN
jgi:hypothetical protein